MGQTSAVTTAAARGPASAPVKAKRPTDWQPNGAECESTPPRFILSPRQTQILSDAALGLQSNEIAAVLGLSAQTVRHHLMATRLKLNARNTTHAVAIALVDHLITLEDR